MYFTATVLCNCDCCCQRFQKTYEALDQEQVAETRQLLLIHEERVQTSLNKKRQDVLNKYRNLLSDDTAKVMCKLNTNRDSLLFLFYSINLYVINVTKLFVY